MKKLLSVLLCAVMALLPVMGLADEPVTVELSHEWASFSMGDTHSAAIQPEHLGYAWGYNYDGAIGNGITASSNTTVPYNWGENITAVSANNKTTAYITESGELYLMGRIWWGTGGTSDMPTPYVYPNGYRLATNVRQVSMGFNHLVFVKNDNTLWVYGENDHGQLGRGNTTNSYTPVQVQTGVSYAVAGNNLTVCVKTDGNVYACGLNTSGQVGNNSTTDQKSFVQVTGLTNVYTVSCMGDHVMAIKNDGTLWAWGNNEFGQLGNGNTTNQKKAVQVMTGVAQVSAGMYHTGVIKTDGTLWFAGNNWRGQFGTGTTTGYSTANSTFRQTQGTYLAVSCGCYTTAVCAPTGQLYVAGNNTYGQLGNETTGASFPTLSPINVWIFNTGDDPGPQPVINLGDVNCDGFVDFSDVSALYAYLMNTASLSEQGMLNADINGTGTLTMEDASLLCAMLIGG